MRVIIRGVEHDFGRAEFSRTLPARRACLHWRNPHWDVLSVDRELDRGAERRQGGGFQYFRPRQMAHAAMRSNPFLLEAEKGTSRYTHLFACISEDDDGYTVQVRLSNSAKPEDTAWGEEIADTFETASMLVAALAAEFSIEQERIKIEIRLDKITSGTLH